VPKNIIVFSDGTGQDGGVRPEQRVSNVYKMYRVCRTGPDSGIDPARQVAFYDPGLGTDIGTTAMSAPIRYVQKMLASVTGRGITTNIADCYEFIINHYQPGDRIFLIGFSRGAYTARAVANLLMLCGVPTRTPDGPLPLFRKATRDVSEEAVREVLEHGAGHPREKYEAERFEQARRFRDRYGSDHVSGEEDRSNVAPYFIGVFDTVAALGAVGFRRYAILSLLLLGLIVGLTLVAIPVAAPLAGLLMLADLTFWTTFLGLIAAADVIGVAVVAFRWLRSTKKTIRDYPTKGQVSSHRAEWKGQNFDRLLSKFVSYARSANAIDETRADFDRVAWGGKEAGTAPDTDGPERLVQFWFAGNHSDVGGSYPEAESRLSDISLKWMIEQATEVPDPLIVDGQPTLGDANGIPKLHLFPASDGLQHCEIAGMRDAVERMAPKWLRRFTGSLGWKVKVREIPRDAPVHPSVVERFAFRSVPQCGGSGPYRPVALAGHDLFKHLYRPGAAAPPAT
jgi:uncharacterized protein (DUF2235 family)